MINGFKVRTGLSLNSLTSDPSNGEGGDFYYNSSTSRFRLYENGAWRDVVSVDETQTLTNKALSNGTSFSQTVDSTTTGSSVDLTLPVTPFNIFTNASLVSIRSITSGAAGKFLILKNDTGNSVVLNNEDVTATASNRIQTGTGSNLTILNNVSVSLIYDSNASRWIIQGINNSATVTDVTNWVQSGFQNFVDTSTIRTATTGSPSSSQFYSAITNRSSMVDLSQDLKVSLGTERLMINQIYHIPTEFGASNEPVYGIVNDTFNQVRLVGSWSFTVDSNGRNADTTTVNNYIEVVFYGTGLALLLTPASSMDFRITVDNGVEGSNLALSYSTVLNGKGTNSHTVVSLVSGLTLGVHTVKIRNNAVAGIKFSGLQILNEQTTLKVNPGSSYISGAKTTLASLQSPAYNSSFESGSLGTKGGRVIVYQKSDGTVAKAITATNSSASALGSSVSINGSALSGGVADHSNEEISREYRPREFGVNGAVTGNTDFTQGQGNSSRYGSLDDNHTILVTSDYSTEISGQFTTSSGLPEGLDFTSTSTTPFVSFTFVGTGLDFTNVTGAATNSTYTVYIDGVSVATGLTGSGSFGNGLNNVVKIASGLPYGSHRVTIRATARSTPTLVIGSFIVYRPKTPALPSGAILIDSYDILANYVASTLGGSATNDTNTTGMSTGVIRHEARKSATFIGSWSFGSTEQGDIYIPSNAPRSTTTTDYVEFPFFGTSIDYRAYTQGTAAGTSTFTISIDGVTNLSGAGYTTSTAGNGVSFNASTGVWTVGTAANGSSGSLVSISNIPLGWHTIKVVFTSRVSGIMAPACFDVGCPIFATKSNTTYDQQNTIAIGTQSHRDERVLSPIKDANLQKKNISQSFGVTANPTTSSTVDTPMADMNTEHRNSTGRIKVSYSASIDSDTVGGTVTTTVYVNGISAGRPKVYTQATSSSGVNSDSLAIDVPVGTNKVDVYWSVSAGSTGTALDAARNILVEEVL